MPTLADMQPVEPFDAAAGGRSAALEFESDHGPHEVRALAIGDDTVILTFTLDTGTAARLVRAYDEAVPADRCPYCKEPHAEEARTHQQWQCACCGSWNDHPPALDRAALWDRLAALRLLISPIFGMGEAERIVVELMNTVRPGSAWGCGFPKPEPGAAPAAKDRPEPSREQRLEATLVGLLGCIVRHYEGDEQDLDVIGEDIANTFDIADRVAAAAAYEEEDADE